MSRYGFDRSKERRADQDDPKDDKERDRGTDRSASTRGRDYDRTMHPPLPSSAPPSLRDKVGSFIAKRQETAPMKTPRNVRTYTPSPEREKDKPKKHGYDEGEWNNADEARQWYEGGDEFGGGDGGAGLEGAQLDGAYTKQRLKEREQSMLKSMQGRVNVKNLRAQQRNEDANRWEESRMHAAGAMEAADMEQIDDDLEAGMVRLVAKKPTPPFLSGGVQFTKRQELVLPVVATDCELYENAKKGSELLRFIRQMKDRQQADRDAVDDSGTQLGKIKNNGVDAAEQKREERRALRMQRKTMTEDEVQKEEVAAARKNASFSTMQGVRNTTAFYRQQIRDQRERLPIYHCRAELLQCLRENEIIVLVGETGSGKTTQIVQYLYESGYASPATATRKKRMIACTQPRRVAAVSVAERVADEVGCETGSTVGYSIRFEDCTSEDTLIKYMTDGVLLRESMRDPTLSQYSAVIMDEAHERSLNTDVLFGILKQCVGRRRDLKLIVTSATMDAERFCSFFTNCPLFQVPGRMFPVDTFYKQSNVADYVDAAVRQAIDIHTQAGANPGDILIFMTGQEEIEGAAAWIKKKLIEMDSPCSKTLMVLPIYSLLPSEMQAKIFNPAPPGIRKCIIATNIAETSLTVDGILYVIDTGFCKLKLFNPRTGMDSLCVFPESRAASNQRKGRAGRTGPGKCYRLFTEYQFNHEMLEMTVPEIQRTSLSSVILLLKSLGVKNLLHFEFMDPPPQENMAESMYFLWMIGALSDSGDLTTLGSEMNDFPVEPAMSKCIIESVQEGCADEMLTIVACLSSQASIFLRPKEQQDLADQMREKFVVSESDHLTLLNAFQMFKSNGRSQGWCNEHFMNFKALKRVEEVRVQLREILVKKRRKLASCDMDWDVLRRVLCSGFFAKCSRRRGVDEYITMLTSVRCWVHPSSSLFNGGSMPDYVIYHELIYTQKEYMNTVTVIDGRWMAEIAPKFFSVRGQEGQMFEPVAAVEEKRPEEKDLASLSNEKAIAAVLGKKKAQQIAEVGGGARRATTPRAAVDRRATPARTPAAGGATPRRKRFF